MKKLMSHIKSPQRMLAYTFLVLFPFHTILIYGERFVNGYKWEYGTLGYYGIEIIGWLLVLSLFMPVARRAQRARVSLTTDRKFLLAALAVVLYSFVSTFWAMESDIAQQQTLRMLLMLLMFITIPSVLSRKEIVASLSIGALVPIGIALYQFFAQDLFASTWLGMSGPDVAEGGVSIVQFGQERWLRAYGTFAHPNVFGGFLALIIIGVLDRMRTHISRWGELYYMILLLLSGVALVLSMSRSAWIATAFGIGVIIALDSKRKRVSRIPVGKGLVTLLLGILFAVSISAPLVTTRVFGGTAHEAASVSERIALQQRAADIFMDHPALGTGAGNMTAALIASDSVRPGYVYQPTHNVAMLLAVEYGVVGVLLFLILGYYFVRFVFALPVEKSRLLFLLVLLPLILFDHYLWTSVHGLGIGMLFLAILLCPNDLSSEKLSTEVVDDKA